MAAATLARGGAVAKELQAAIHAVRAACSLGRAVQATLGDADKQIKADSSPVTVADYGVQALVVLSLHHQLAGSPTPFHLVAEEDPGALHGHLLERVVLEVNDAYPRPHGGSWSDTDITTAIGEGGYSGDCSKPFWVLDPIDGTKGFVRGDQYAVGLAYVVKGVPVLGVLGCPNLPCHQATDDPLGCVFSAAKGFGTTMHSLDGTYEGQVHVKDPTSVEESVMCESFVKAHSSRGLSMRVSTALGLRPEPVRIDSMAKYCLLSRGDASLYLRLSLNREECVWDHAAGVVVAGEAGATITDVAGKALDFTKGRTLAANRGVVASSGRFHNEALEALRVEMDKDRAAAAATPPVAGVATASGAGGAGAGSGAGGADSEASRSKM